MNCDQGAAEQKGNIVTLIEICNLESEMYYFQFI